MPPKIRPEADGTGRIHCRILIVGGGGTMGSSAALHLARRGYKDITILDVFPIPSYNSAGNDLNKVQAFDI